VKLRGSTAQLVAIIEVASADAALPQTIASRNNYRRTWDAALAAYLSPREK